MHKHALVLTAALYLGVPALGLGQTVETALAPHPRAEPPALTETPPPISRPASLMPLYAGLAAAHVLDLHSSHLALAGGAREGNPVASFISRHPAAAVGVKIGVTGLTIWAAERMWRGHRRTSAVVLLAAVTALQTTIDLHNYRVAARLRER